ncbi:MAG: Cna protein B-type domain containing protein [Hyphomicrobiaceae bacterium]|nr:MAG: Cna protein B-type domain containing protein [Hyphomicrobiaceae bacterium]
MPLLQDQGFAQRPAIAKEVVFDDRGRTGRRRPGDPGIANVMVSNGRDIVRTAADGSWSLPVAEGDSLFVIKPPSWTTPIGFGGIPRFSRLHQPHGTPGDIDYRFAGVAPTGPLPASIDFALRRQEERRDFEALLFTDTQPENAVELAYLRDDIVAGAIGSNAAFGINHGDVMFDDLSLYERYLDILGTTGMPWHHCPGNHDINSEASDDRFSRETWKRFFGPRHYAFQYAGATFVILDNVAYLGHNPGSATSGQYRGMIGERQLQFVRNLLANLPPDDLIVLSMHIPLVTYHSPDNPSDTTVDRRALMELLSHRQHTVSFSGHMHMTEHHYLDAKEGFWGREPHHHHVLTAASGSWWSGPNTPNGIPLAHSCDGSPNGFHVLSVDGNKYSTRFVPSSKTPAAQLRIFVDGPHRRIGGEAGRNAAAVHRSLHQIPADAIEACEVVANIFDGGPRTRVAFEIADVTMQRVWMQRAASVDPFIVDVFAAHKAALKSWVEPVPSSHVWKGRLPANLKPGAHRVLVRAWDEYGREHASHMVIEVTARKSNSPV